MKASDAVGGPDVARSIIARKRRWMESEYVIDLAHANVL